MSRTGSGWGTPQIIIGILSLLSSAGWAWVGLSHGDGNRIEDRLRAAEIRIERLSTQIEAMGRRP